MPAPGVMTLRARRRSARRNGATGSRGSQGLAASAGRGAARALSAGDRPSRRGRRCPPPTPARRRSPRRSCAPQDRIALCEAHPEEREKLIAALGRDSRLSIVGTDGYVALNAYLPPKERRGLVLIDPPFEAPDEPKRVEEALARALRKWPTGIYLAMAADPRAGGRRALSQQRRRARRAQHPRLELDVGAGPVGAHGQRPLARAGPPDRQPAAHAFRRGAALMPWLAKLLGARRPRGHICEWLTEPRE